MSESFRPIPLRINYNTANLIDTDGESLYANATPAFRLGEKGIIEATFVQDDNSTAQPFNSTDTFEFYADKDFIHNLDTGALTQGYSGLVTSANSAG